MSWEIIREPARPHTCLLPGASYDYLPGTIIECTDCETRWQLVTVKQPWPLKNKLFWEVYAVPVDPDDFGSINDS